MPDSSHKVWVVGYLPGNTTGVLLSKIGDHWELGPVERWWREYEQLAMSHPFSDWRLKEQKALEDRFPVCQGKAVSSESEPLRTARP